MKRREFLSDCTLVTAGCLVFNPGGLHLVPGPGEALLKSSGDLYSVFTNPGNQFRPFVRWWWNGNKVEAAELVRELHVLKEAGIGGVEINPVQFPSRFPGDDLGRESLPWLSNEWIDMLSVVFREAKSLGMTCDLIVGSGWPFGAEYLNEEERLQIVVISVRKVTGPIECEILREEIIREADPPVSSPFPGRKMELLSLSMVTDPVSDPGRIIDLSHLVTEEIIRVNVPEGNHAIYALVKVTGFMQVINGAPGASGPVLNHYDRYVVERYLNRMSDAIEKKTGPLSDHLRAMFIDSMELEGANWSSDMTEEFRKRRGYDIFPFLPFILFRTGIMGNTADPDYGAETEGEFKEMIRRMRFDFEVTKAELLEERFVTVYSGWCKKLGVRSRMQAYGRGFFPLDSSFDVDIPECESWTMNYLKHKVGEEMPEDDYRRGRAYTMINKYVSSAAHLAGKRVVSCEEMTDTYAVFNTSLENLKIGGDQSAVTGVTHSVFHGFNYSPPEAPYPGWIRYGCYYNEKNNWWPYFHIYNDYKRRLSALLQNASMYADIGILPPDSDMWSETGAQSEPFPAKAYTDYLTLVWEAIVKNGSGCDYISERVLEKADVSDGSLRYGPRKFNTLFLVRVKSLSAAAATKLFDFVSSGGRVFCMEYYPDRSTGWKDHEARDEDVKNLTEKMKAFPDRFILLQRPDRDFITWYGALQKKFRLKPYLTFSIPDAYVMQARYQADDSSEVILLINSHIHKSHYSRVRFSREITRGRYGWIWDPETGERYRINLSADNSIEIDMGPGSSFIFVFDKTKGGTDWSPAPGSGQLIKELSEGWTAKFIHCRDKVEREVKIERLQDLKEMAEFSCFSGTVIYKNSFVLDDIKGVTINLGKVFGVSGLVINGQECGTRWYGRRIFSAEHLLNKGENTIEIKVITSMGNYMKTLRDNPIAQYWTNEKNKVQPLQSMGLTGPVTIYKA